VSPPHATLVSPDQHWALLGILLAVAAAGFWAEETRIGARFSGAVAAILGSLVLANLRVIPSSAPVYDMVWSYLVPLGIPLLLFKADLGRILRESGPTLFAYVAGAVGCVAGTWAAYQLVPLGEEGWKLAGIFCATYIGGSINFVAVARALGMRSGDLLSAAVAADQLVMALYFLLLLALPSLGWLRRRFRVRVPSGPEGGGGEGAVAQKDREAAPRLEHAARDIATALAVSGLVCAAGFALAGLVGQESLGILFVTGIAVALASLLRGRLERIAGADQSGMLLMQIFFAAVGASASIATVLRVGPALFLFAGTVVLVHFFASLAAGALFRLDLLEVIIASNANTGGPATAAAMAAARGWRTLIIPGILCGTLGYAVATFIGIAVAHGVR
jgi:uncharacterized membrane protein